MALEEDRHQVGTPQEARREVEKLVRRFARNLKVCIRPYFKVFYGVLASQY